MSRHKNDRKFQSTSRKTFQDVDTEAFVKAIALALKAEFGATPSALKTVAQLTHSNERAVRNWFEEKNGPSGANLVTLMRHSDRVLRTVLELADQRDLVLAVELTRLRQRLIDAVAEIDSLPPRADPAR
jgi:hypothetical protein